jgi:nucleoid-associated protein YgaU
MLASTVLSIFAQLSRVQGAIKATSLFTLPGVTRMVEGAVAVTLATSSFVGVHGGVAYADDSNTITLVSDDSAGTLGNADDFSVATPRPAGVVSSVAASAGDQQTVGAFAGDIAADSSVTDSAAADAGTTPTTSVEDNSVATPRPGSAIVNAVTAGTAAGSTTTVPPTTSSTTPTTQPQVSRSSSNGNDNSVSVTPLPSNTTTTSPSTDAPPSSDTEVLGVNKHRVQVGENLWTISRDAIATATNRSASDISNEEIAHYWTVVIETNQSHLLSGDPHWIFPNEVIDLPDIAK